jgi:hypothetical protein
VIQLKTDCRSFRGDIPCKPHKQSGVHCVDSDGQTCPYYDRVEEKILIIKLGAVGDVIRTTPLLYKLKEEYPRAKIFWLTGIFIAKHRRPAVDAVRPPLQS